ncbi:MAG: tRNA (N(6)-L-threonylcarbamoyladenosine(37)-C(2))-methylthiotransferase MtaB [Marinilabiliales bacterium]
MTNIQKKIESIKTFNILIKKHNSNTYLNIILFIVHNFAKKIVSHKKKIAFSTLGCKLNFLETSMIASQFNDSNYAIVDEKEKADIYIINTCTVTSSADKKSMSVINKLKKQNPEARFIITGCLAQLQSDKFSNNNNVLVVGNAGKQNIKNYIENYDNGVIACEYSDLNSFFPAYSFGDRTRSFLKIQDGCDYFCSYCTVPYARGKSRNTAMAEIVNTAEKLSRQNCKEIILSGINLGDFGKTTGEKLIDLFRSLDKVEGIKRYRISSIEPNLLTEEIIDFVSSSHKFMPHFHIPLQSGSDFILALMKRRYNTSLFKKKVEQIKNKMPHAAIGADVITGFPGESDKYFLETYKFIETMDLSYLHVFRYSDRKGTPAYKMTDKVSSTIKKERSNILHKLSNELQKKFILYQADNEHMILFEKYNNNGNMYGYTENYIRVKTVYNQVFANKIIKAKIKADINKNLALLENGTETIM